MQITVNAGLRTCTVLFVQLTMEKGEIRLLGPDTHNTEEAVLTIKNSGSVHNHHCGWDPVQGACEMT